MLRYLFVLTVALMSLNAVGQETSDIRNVRWGMTREEVKNTEYMEELNIDLQGIVPEGFEKLSETLSLLIYQTNVLEINTYLVYVFVADRLVAVAYSFNPDHTSFRLYASDFSNVNNSLSGKYGRWRSDVDTASDLQRKAGMDLGFLLDLGDYRRTVEWFTKRTVIRHQITSVKRTVSHVLFYESTDSYNARKKASQSDI